jgi:hypothetical protein
LQHQEGDVVQPAQSTAFHEKLSGDPHGV